MSDTPSYDPTPQPSSSSKGLPPALANLSDSTLLWVQVGGGILAFISVLLPWVTVPAIEFFGERIGGGSINGFDYSGLWATLLLLLGLAIAALSFIKVRGMQVQGLEKLPSYLPLVLAGALGLISLIVFIDVLSDVSGTGLSTSVGIWFLLIAGLVPCAAALRPVLKARRG